MIRKYLGLTALTAALVLVLLLPGISAARHYGYCGAYGWGGYGWGGSWGGWYGPRAYAGYYYPGAYGWASAAPAPQYMAGQYPAETAQGAQEESEAGADEGQARIHFDVTVPANADIWFEGEKTQQRGEVRHFVSPPLETSRPFTYNIRARWTDNGQQVERNRKVEARAGERVSLDLRRPTDADTERNRQDRKGEDINPPSDLRDRDRLPGDFDRPGTKPRDIKPPSDSNRPPADIQRPPVNPSRPTIPPKTSPPSS